VPKVPGTAAAKSKKAGSTATGSTTGSGATGKAGGGLLNLATQVFKDEEAEKAKWGTLFAIHELGHLQIVV